MPYFLTRPRPKKETLTFEEVLFDLVDESKLSRINVIKPAISTRTHYVQTMPKERMSKMGFNVYDDIYELKNFYDRNKHLDIFYNPKCNYKKQLLIRSEIKKRNVKKRDSD